MISPKSNSTKFYVLLEFLWKTENQQTNSNIVLEYLNAIIIIERILRLSTVMRSSHFDILLLRSTRKS